MRKGYRNPDSNFDIDSTVHQFGFRLVDNYLKFIDFKKDDLAHVERVNIYLKDQRILKNIFIVGSVLAYYYEKKWYYSGHIYQEGPPTPPMNIFKRFNFSMEDIILIKEDNNPKPAIRSFILRVLLFPFSGWLLFPPKNLLDYGKSIEKNIFVKQEKWKRLPETSEDDIYRV